MTILLPLDDAWKVVALEAAQHAQEAFRRLSDGKGFDQEIAASGTAEPVKGEVRFPKRTADSLEEKIVTPTNPTTLQIRSGTAPNSQCLVWLSVMSEGFWHNVLMASLRQRQMVKL
jgi:hypothetical protein